MAPVMIYMTAATVEEAARIGRILVEQRFAACANVLPHMTSIFRWEGRMQEESEAVLIVKTMASHVDAIIERIKAVHSYSCPCAVVLPISGGNPAFLDWIDAETAQR